MKKITLALALIAGLSAPAFAGQCPALMTKIEEAMKTATLDDASKTKVTELLAGGKADHEAGNHDSSVAKLNEALALMGM